MLRQATLLGIAIIGLAFLGDDIFLPALGKVAEHFGVDEKAAQSYGVFPYYGFAIAGFVHAALAGRLSLGVIIAVGLVAGASSNLAGLIVGDWSTALVMRLLSGLGFGLAVGGATLAITRLASGAELSRSVSISFSGAGIALAPTVAMVPYLAERAGLVPMALAHLAFTLVLSVVLIRTPILMQAGSDDDEVVRRKTQGIGSLKTLPGRLLHSSAKRTTLLICLLGLTGSYLTITGLQPVLSSIKVSPTHIGLFFSAFMIMGMVSGFLHAYLVGKFGIYAIRRLIIFWDLLVCFFAVILWTIGFHAPAIGMILLRTAFGGTPSFEGHAADLLPREDGALAFQRAVLQIFAATLVAIFTWVSLGVIPADYPEGGVTLPTIYLAVMLLIATLKALAWCHLVREEGNRDSLAA